ncbi:DUF4304 domain-containing protein [Paenibacillus sp. GSMTC-2017]|uniref:DUF4304 domain-containing protein n=1 Tax=Paenibacillus sp. GSMTC-2017 TaxID=2794350 RepID=UPI0018D9F899|nr:DUF4304 domain-containing protein [Paenibacillus sp. GSMTC-2017]
MNKTEFVEFLNSLFTPYLFTRKGHRWRYTNNGLTKTIKLTKSYYSNSYYVNYGYIIQKLELGGFEMHIFNGLSSMENEENATIMEILDLDTPIADIVRKEKLARFINKEILDEFNNINNENDLLVSLMERPNLNDVPLCVKQYFQIPIE